MLSCLWISLKAAFWNMWAMVDFINYLTFEFFPEHILLLQRGILRQETEMASSIRFLTFNRAMNKFLRIRR